MHPSLRRFLKAAVPLGLRLALRKRSTVAQVWDRRSGGERAALPRHWTELDQVQEVINRRVTGDGAVDPYMYLLRTRLFGRLPVPRALTIGCGTGVLERGLAGHGFALRHDGLDLSPRSVETAIAAAERAGLGHLHYRVADGNLLELEPETYDVVFGVHAVHHISGLEHLFRQVATALKPGGYLLLNEYVGPSRFQWTEGQLEAVNGLLRTLPEELRVDVVDGRPKRRARRPTVAEVIATDPSEAVRSAEILHVAESFFEFVELRPYGGTILQLLLEDIAGNFTRPGGCGRDLLASLCDLEWALVSSGALPSDFAVVIATPRGSLPASAPER